MAESTTMTMGAQGGGGGPYVEKPEETATWAKLVRRFERNGGQNVTLDLRVKWTKFKHPHELYRYNPTSGKRELVTPNGMMVVMQTTQPGVEGLYFFKDGKLTLDPRSFLYGTVMAASRGKFKDGQEVTTADIAALVSAEFLLPVTMKGEAQRQGKPDLSRGGHYWNLGIPKPIPVDDDDDDDMPSPPAQVAASATAAPDDDDDYPVPF